MFVYQLVGRHDEDQVLRDENAARNLAFSPCPDRGILGDGELAAQHGEVHVPQVVGSRRLSSGQFTEGIWRWWSRWYVHGPARVLASWLRQLRDGTHPQRLAATACSASRTAVGVSARSATSRRLAQGQPREVG